MASQITPLARARDHQSRARQFGARAAQAFNRANQLVQGGTAALGAAGLEAGRRQAQNVYDVAIDPMLQFGAGALFGTDTAPPAAAAAPAPAPPPTPPMPADLQQALMEQAAMPSFGDVQSGASTTATKPWDDAATLAVLAGLEDTNRKATDLAAKPYTYMAEHGDPAGELARRRAELEAGGFTEFAPGQGYKGPSLKGGGTVSMMTAPENAARVTAASDLEDAITAARLTEAQRASTDPLWREREMARMQAEPLVQRAQTEARLKQEATQGLEQRKQSVLADMRASLDAMRNDPNLTPEAKRDWEDRILTEAKLELEAIDPRGDYSKIGGLGL